MEKRIYPEGSKVEVWRPRRDEWVRGRVFGYAEREGVWKYLVQLSGYMAMSPDDPNCWFTAEEMRPA